MENSNQSNLLDPNENIDGLSLVFLDAHCSVADSLRILELAKRRKDDLLRINFITQSRSNNLQLVDE